LRMGVGDVQEAAYAGSTASGIRCARRAGARIVAGVLTGGHTRERLRAAGAMHFITGIAEFPALLTGTGHDAPDMDTPGASAAEEPRRDAGTESSGGRGREQGPARAPRTSATRIAPAWQVP